MTEFLAWQAAGDDEEPAPVLSADNAIALEAWNLAAGGEIVAVPWVCEALGIDDPADLMRAWVLIRETMRPKET